MAAAPLAEEDDVLEDLKTVRDDGSDDDAMSEGGFTAPSRWNARKRSASISDDDVMPEIVRAKQPVPAPRTAETASTARKGTAYDEEEDVLSEGRQGTVYYTGSDDEDVLSEADRGTACHTANGGDDEEEDVLPDASRRAKILSCAMAPPSAMERQCSTVSIPDAGSVKKEEDEEEDVMREMPLLPPRSNPTFKLILMDDEPQFFLPAYSEQEIDEYLLGKKPVEPPAPTRPAPKKPRITGVSGRPVELEGPSLSPTVVARAWWQAMRMTFSDTKDHRKPEVICNRGAYTEESVRKDVYKAWAKIAKKKFIQVLPKHKTKKIITGAVANCLDFVFECGMHDRATVSQGVCGARVTFPTGGSHRGRDPGQNPHCGNKSTSKRHLCSRCSQLFFRVENDAAFVLLTIYALTAKGDNVSAHLDSLVRLIHWFTCQSTYLNRSFFYSDIQTWTVSIVNGVVGERVSLAESVAAQLLTQKAPLKLERAPT